MSNYENKLKQFAIDLYKIDAIKFGEYKTKIGVMTPVYCDLRVIVSYPALLETLCDLIGEYMKTIHKKIDIICGVPYTALPIATIVSTKTKIPMVMRRKETKDYGTKKLIEGKFNSGDNCLIIEDVVTSGSSILETVKDLKNAGIQCQDAIVLLNRQQGGEALLQQNSIKMHALLNLTQLIGYLQDAGFIDGKIVEKVAKYLSETQITSIETVKEMNRLKVAFEERLEFVKNPVSRELMEIIIKKQSTLCIAADLTKTTDILNLAEEVGPYICLFKTHIDIIEDFHPNFLKHLKSIAEKHEFLLFEDRKFADIGKTVQLQYNNGIYQISSWAKLVTAHSLTGKGVLDAIQQVVSQDDGGRRPCGVFLLAETSADGSLIDANYTKNTINLAENYENLVVGIVGQTPQFLNNYGLLQLTPGVQLDSIGDQLSQRYNTPDCVVLEKGADIAVVGRGITQAPDRVQTAQKYQQLLWASYKKRLQQ